MATHRHHHRRRHGRRHASRAAAEAMPAGCAAAFAGLALLVIGGAILFHNAPHDAPVILGIIVVVGLALALRRARRAPAAPPEAPPAAAELHTAPAPEKPPERIIQPHRKVIVRHVHEGKMVGVRLVLHDIEGARDSTGASTVTKIVGYCNQTRSNRTFHLANISELLDAETGELIPDLWLWLHRPN